MHILQGGFLVKRTSWGFLVLLSVASPLLGQTVTDPSLNVEIIITGLSQPTTMAFIGANEFLVLQKSNGQVRYVRNDTLQTTVALDVNVSSVSERGLLGICVNPNDLTDVFLYFTEASGNDGGSVLGNRVYRYTWNATTERLESPSLILDLPTSPGPNHDAGILVCERVDETTAYLYTIIGDLNRNGQLQNFPAGPEADNTGVILRTQLNGNAAPGNPFSAFCSATTATTCANSLQCPPGEACLTEVERYFAYGIRNSFGMALDPVTGFLWDTENGPGSYDEINRVVSGFNSGWEQIMGPDSRDPQGVGDLFVMPGGGSAYSDPEFSWLNTVAPTALVFPAGSSLGANYEDVAIVGDNNTGQLYAFPLNGGRTAFDLSAHIELVDLVADTNPERDLLRMGTGFGVITDLKIGPDTNLYVVSLSAGTIFRIRGSGPVSVLDRVRESGFLLQQNHPNPFSGQTRIQFDVARVGAEVQLEIFDVAGRAVRTLLNDHVDRGPTTALWDGTDRSGRAVAAGLYYYRLTVDGVSRTRKMIYVR